MEGTETPVRCRAVYTAQLPAIHPFRNKVAGHHPDYASFDA